MIFRCFNSQCKGIVDNVRHEFESVVRKCPICGAKDAAIIAVLIHHLIVQDVENGRIDGQHGIGYRCVCNPSLTRKDLGDRMQVGTLEPFAVNCRKCLASAEWRELATPFCEKVESGLYDGRLIPSATKQAQAAFKEIVQSWL